MFDVFSDDAGEHRWRVTADNNEPIATPGEGYEHEVDAIHGAGVTMRQLLEHHPDRLRILGEWLADQPGLVQLVPMHHDDAAVTLCEAINTVANAHAELPPAE